MKRWSVSYFLVAGNACEDVEGRGPVDDADMEGVATGPFSVSISGT